MNGRLESAEIVSPAAWLADLCSPSSRHSSDSRAEAFFQAGAVFQSLADGLPANILVKDIHGQRVFVNRGYLELHQANREELLGKTDADLFPPEVARKYQADDAKVLQTGTAL